MNYTLLLKFCHTGFKETNKGCCGSGLFEVATLCNEFTSTCDDPSKYVFWDSVHPTQLVYQYIAKYIQREVLPMFQFHRDMIEK